MRIELYKMLDKNANMMKRKIEFRAKTLIEDSQEWCYGYFSKGPEGCYISNESGNCYPVDENTVCQYTGLKDKDGRKIYEGDILDFDESEWGDWFKPEVIWMENIIGDWNYCGSLSDVTEWRRVIGNIYDIELLNKNS